MHKTVQPLAQVPFFVCLLTSWHSTTAHPTATASSKITFFSCVRKRRIKRGPCLKEMQSGYAETSDGFSCTARQQSLQAKQNKTKFNLFSILLPVHAVFERVLHSAIQDVALPCCNREISPNFHHISQSLGTNTSAGVVRRVFFLLENKQRKANLKKALIIENASAPASSSCQ